MIDSRGRLFKEQMLIDAKKLGAFLKPVLPLVGLVWVAAMAWADVKEESRKARVDIVYQQAQIDALSRSEKADHDVLIETHNDGVWLKAWAQGKHQ